MVVYRYRVVIGGTVVMKMIFPFLIMTAAAVLYLVFAIVGRKKLWANVVTLIMGIATMAYAFVSIAGGVI